MIAIIDYGVGNLFSLKSSLDYIGVESIITNDKSEILKADKIILPGVGAFRDAIKKLADLGLDIVIKEEANKNKPILGICLGMQLLFDVSYEFGIYKGLSLIPGEIKPLKDVTNSLKIPHMGWNKLIFNKNSSLFKYIKDGDYVYFVHSFYGKTNSEFVSSYTEYGTPLTASCEYKNVYGTQFHPEKSGDAGLNILKAFSELE
ncbi:imidazole glycerol phosphate synthase subunit HisH [bacterium]|nr:imidazole glycerol phosphate synthase subunit HisH [bacterium]